MNAAVLTATAPEVAAHNRRTSLRFDALNRVVAEFVASGTPVKVRDVGFGGFALETVDRPASEGTETLRFLASGGWSTEVQAERVYCRPSCAADGSPRYVSGFAVTQQNAEEKMMAVIERITSVRYTRKVARTIL